MQISSLIDIIEGVLLNSPSISFIYSFKTNPNKVKEGDLFFAKNIDDVELAVKNGAFAIVLDKSFPIIDLEIAWIKVENLNLSIIQLIRFKLANINLESFYTDDVTYDLLKIYSSNSSKKINFISNEIDTFLNEINDIEDNQYLISPNKNILEKIYPNSNFLCIKNYEIENLIEHSIFEVSFSYKNTYYSRIKISKLYINNFLLMEEFIDEELDFTKLKSLNHFKAIFLDKSFNVTDFGRSDKFLLTQENKNLYKNEIDYLLENYKYGKIKILTKKYLHNFPQDQVLLEDLLNLKDVLKKESFNCFYIIDYNFNDILNTLTKPEKESSLF